MERLFEALRPLIKSVIRRPLVVLVVATALAAIGVHFTLQLRIDTDLANLLPRSYTSVQALDRLKETIGAESEAAVAFVSPSYEANRALAERFIPDALAMTRPETGELYFTRVEYTKEVDFLRDNALYFASDAELQDLESSLERRIEDAKLEANPFFFELDDEEEVEEPDAEERLRAVYDQIVEKPVPISDDSTTLVLRFFPAGSQTNIGFIDDLYADLQALVDRIDPKSYDPAMEVVLAGRLQRQLVEVRTITDDVLRSFGVGVLAVILLVISYFFYKALAARGVGGRAGREALKELTRTPVIAAVIGLPLLMSLAWTFAAAYLAFTELNLMTSTLGLVLFGLGIDYGIHFFARYSEERGSGLGVAEAVEATFMSTGQAIAAGACTTAVALYSLLIADFKGFSEFGFIAGTGILFALVAMTIVLPAFLVVFERLGALDFGAGTVQATRQTEARPFPYARSVLVVSLVIVVASFFYFPPKFEYDFGRLEPRYEEYNARREIIRRVYPDGSRRNPAYVVVDDPADVPIVVTALGDKIAADTTSPTIAEVESLQERFPLNASDQQAKLERIAHVREMLNDPFIVAEESDDLDKLRRAAQTTRPITENQVPEFLKKKFASKSGEIGNFVIIYSSLGLSNGRNSIAFAEDVGTIVAEDGRTFHAGSTSLVAADMLRLMRRESPWMVAITFTVVLLLMWLYFGSIRLGLLAVLPLVVGVLAMLLIMGLFGMKLNFYNLIVLPAILGIGNDAGVHIVHRYLEEGRGSILRVLRSTGEHVTMGSLTTMIGFAGPLLSFHPGLQTIGKVAVAGIGTTLLASLVFLPALLQWLETRGVEESVEEPAAV